MVDRSYNAWSCSSKDIQLLRWSARLAQDARWARVERTTRASIEATPIHPQAYDLLAVAVVQQSGSATAVAAMTQVAELQPDVPWPRRRLAELYLQLGLPTEAAAQARTANELEETGRWDAEQRRYTVPDCEQYIPESG